MSTRWIAAALVFAAVTACGTTVPLGTQGPARVDDPAATGAPEAGTGAIPGTEDLATRPLVGSSARPSTDRTQDSTGGVRSGTPGAGTGSGSGRSGRGVDAKTIRIGFQYVNVGAGTSAVLGRDVSIGDPVAMANAVTRWINAHGGLGGRRMLLDTFGVDYADYVSSPANAAEQVCTHYTQDVAVLAVALYVPDRSLLDCLARRDVVSVSDGYSLDRQSFEQYAKYYWSPGSMSQDRGAEVGVAGLHAAGFLPPTAKVGLMRYDEVTYARAEVSLRKALKGVGLDVVTRTVSYSSTAQAESDAAAAVLDFRSRGITHVMFLDNSGGIAFAFMQAAESQAYRPYYPLTTNNSPSALQQLAPPQQLAKAQAISWWSGDVGTRTDQQTPPALPAARSQCLRIMADAQVDTSGSATGTALITCDQLLLLKAVLDRAQAPNSEAMTAALDRLGSAYSSPLTYGTRFGPRRHDAAYVTRRIRFDAGCSCWMYAGKGPSA